MLLNEDEADVVPATRMKHIRQHPRLLLLVLFLRGRPGLVEFLTRLEKQANARPHMVKKQVDTRLPVSIWWDTVATDAMKADARALLDGGQLEFVVGAWCMADEAIVEQVVWWAWW